LHRIEPGIETIAADKLIMAASLDHDSAIDDVNQVSEVECGQPMRNDQCRTPANERP
jgi:hypothetical protein